MNAPSYRIQWFSQVRVYPDTASLFSDLLERETPVSRMWVQVYLHCLLAAEMEKPVHFASRIDGALLPDSPGF